jgi:hypothetical protein
VAPRVAERLELVDVAEQQAHRVVLDGGAEPLRQPSQQVVAVDTPVSESWLARKRDFAADRHLVADVAQADDVADDDAALVDDGPRARHSTWCPTSCEPGEQVLRPRPRSDARAPSTMSRSAVDERDRRRTGERLRPSRALCAPTARPT